MACTSVNLFNGLTGYDLGGSFIDVDGVFGAPLSTVSTPTSLDFTGIATGTYTFRYEVELDCNNDGDTLDAGETDTANVSVEVYNLGAISDIDLCDDSLIVYTTIGGGGSLIEGSVNDYIVDGIPSGTWTGNSLGAGTYPVTITLDPNSGAPVECICVVTFTVSVAEKPTLSIANPTDNVCVACDGTVNYNLTTIPGAEDVTLWYTKAEYDANNPAATCNGSTTNAGAPSGSNILTPTSVAISEGINTFVAVRQPAEGASGPCGNIYVCQEVSIIGVPQVVLSEIQIATPAETFCDCTGDFDMVLSDTSNCFKTFYDVLVADGGVVTAAASGYGNRVTHASGAYAEYRWDVLNSAPVSIVTSPTTTTSTEFDIPCTDVDSLVAGTYNISYTALTGYGATSCSNVNDTHTIVHNGCCEDCDYTIELVDETNSDTPLDTYIAGSLVGEQSSSFPDYFEYCLYFDSKLQVTETCPSETNITYPAQLPTDVPAQCFQLELNNFNTVLTAGNIDLIINSVPTNQAIPGSVTDAATMVSWLNGLGIGNSQNFFVSNSTDRVSLYVSDQNTGGFDVTGNGSYTPRGAYELALLSTGNYAVSCGNINTAYTVSYNYGTVDLGLPGSLANIELDFDEITVNGSPVATLSEISRIDQTCENCPE